MTARARKPATYADIEALPPHLVGEILFGTLVTRPRPVHRNGIATTSLGDELVGPFQKGRGGGPAGWLFIIEPEMHLGPHAVVPDIAGRRPERLDGGAAGGAFIEVAPDWACEVLSPSTERYDRGDKRRIKAHFGMQHLWHLDPRAHTLEVFRLQEQDWLLTHTFVETENVCAPPFDANTFSLGLLWPFDPPAEPSAPAPAT
ncbi:MAG: Uma2 family endonuclease [Hyphomicrobiaceae bacterium]